MNNNISIKDLGNSFNCDNVIIADGDYVDSVAFNLIVNFERMIGRHIPKADMAQWVECIGLDGGMRDEDGEGNGSVVILVHDKESHEMNNFNPGVYGMTTEGVANEKDILTGQAFKGRLGEFAFQCVQADNNTSCITVSEAVADILDAVAEEKCVKRIMVVPNLEKEGALDMFRPVIQHIDRQSPDKRVTLFAMEPLSAVACRTEILGYSLMAALGIRSEEIAP